jgi:hypothetical protein
LVALSLDLSTEPRLADEADDPPAAEDAARPPANVGAEAKAMRAADNSSDGPTNFMVFS